MTKIKKLIKRTEIVRPDTTYNLHVEKNHNYVADGTVVSNCHGARGNVLQEILTQHASKIPYRFGVTGTMPKEECDAMSIKCALGPIRGQVTAHELMNAGVLAQLNINVLQLEEDFTAEYERFKEHINTEGYSSKIPTYREFKAGYFPDFAAEKAYLQRSPARMKWIANFLLSRREQQMGNTLCLVDSIPFGRKLAEMIPGAIFVNGQDVKKSKDRQEYYDMFKTSDDLIMIATVHIAGTGLNIRRIFNLVTVSASKSFTTTIQAIGRGLRTASDKTSVELTDICSDLKYSNKHMKDRLKYYDEAKYEYKVSRIQYITPQDR